MPEVGDAFKEAKATLRTPVDIKVVEIALAIRTLALPMVEEGEMQPIDLPILELLACQPSSRWSMKNSLTYQ